MTDPENFREDLKIKLKKKKEGMFLNKFQILFNFLVHVAQRAKILQKQLILYF